jgi:hypothetical protein
MSVERALFNRLTAGTPIASLGNRLYPVAAPARVQMPYATYARVSALRARDTLGPSGLVSARFQIDTYANNYADARAVAEAIRIRLDGYRGTITGSGWSCRIEGISLITDQDLHEPDIEPQALFRVSQDYLIHHIEE